MTRPYDAATKELIESAAADWVAFLGGPADPARVTLIDADVATVTAAADKVIRVADDPPWLLHLEVQSSWDGALPRRVLLYNAVLHHRHALPVASAVVLLRPHANATGLDGELAFAPPVGPGWAFRYTVMRVWTQPPAVFLDGPLGLVPLAPLADLTRADLPGVVRRMRERFAPLDQPTLAKLWSASYLLMGMRFEESLIDVVLQGVLGMEESVTYQRILSNGRIQGRAEEARNLLLRQGRKKFGPPSAAAEAAVQAVGDLNRLEALADRLLDVNTWDDLLAGG